MNQEEPRFSRFTEIPDWREGLSMPAVEPLNIVASEVTENGNKIRSSAQHIGRFRVDLLGDRSVRLELVKLRYQYLYMEGYLSSIFDACDEFCTSKWISKITAAPSIRLLDKSPLEANKPIVVRAFSEAEISGSATQQSSCLASIGMRLCSIELAAAAAALYYCATGSRMFDTYHRTSDRNALAHLENRLCTQVHDEKAALGCIGWKRA